jgi:LPXTG-motif cell wall-anchored protein
MGVRAPVKAALVAIVAAGLTFIIAASVTGTRSHKVTLAAGSGFAVTTFIATLPDCTTPAALFPGVPRCLLYTVHNPSAMPIAVNALAIGAVSAPSVCPADNLDLSAASFSGSFTVPARGSAHSPAMRITLRDTAANQDSCKAATFGFTTSGTAAVLTAASLPASGGPESGNSALRPAPPLPATGADLAALGAIGVGSLAFGLILLRASRRRRRTRVTS